MLTTFESVRKWDRTKPISILVNEWSRNAFDIEFVIVCQKWNCILFAPHWNLSTSIKLPTYIDNKYQISNIKHTYLLRNNKINWNVKKYARFNRKAPSFLLMSLLCAVAEILLFTRVSLRKLLDEFTNLIVMN